MAKMTTIKITTDLHWLIKELAVSKRMKIGEFVKWAVVQATRAECRKKGK